MLCISSIIKVFISVPTGVQERLPSVLIESNNGKFERLLQHTQRIRSATSRNEWNVRGIWKRNIATIITGECKK